MASVEKLCLQWNEFQANVSSLYRDVRKNSDFSDVTLACEDGHRIDAHRIILSSSSEFFRDLLHSSTSSLTTHPLVFMRALPYNTLASVIDFIYHGEVEVKKEDLETFLQVANELRVKGMTKPGFGLNDKTEKSSSGKEKNPKGTTNKGTEAIEKAEIECIEDTRETLEERATENESFESATSPPRQDVKKIETATFECDICGKFYGTAASLRTHKWNHAKKGEVVDKTTENSFKEENQILMNSDLIMEEIDENLSKHIKKEKKMNVDSMLDQKFGDNADFGEKFDQDVQKMEVTNSVTFECGQTLGDNAELEEKINQLSERREDGLWICTRCGKTDKFRFHLRTLSISAKKKERGG